MESAQVWLVDIAGLIGGEKLLWKGLLFSNELWQGFEIAEVIFSVGNQISYKFELVLREKFLDCILR